MYELNTPVAKQAVARQIFELNLNYSPINKIYNANEGYLFGLDDAAVRIIAEQLVEDDMPEDIQRRLPKTSSSSDRDPKPDGGDQPMQLSEFDRSAALDALINYIANKGFSYEPWQVACFVTALRTKPFVILAGVTGTGKSKLPKLVCQGTGGLPMLVPVRPDWTDSADILGYVDLEGRFRPGQFLAFARKANEAAGRLHLCIVDEMNLGRVEHYFAEVLSRIEDREAAAGGGFRSDGLLGLDLHSEDQVWRGQGIGPNLAIVGTVNMDESTHGFSRKVLDRAFTIELSEIDLGLIQSAASGAGASITAWPVAAWHPLAIRLGALPAAEHAKHAKTISDTIGVLQQLNAILVHAQLQLGYRSRDEIVLFVLHAQDLIGHFVTRSKDEVDPVDLAIMMKVLPRIVGGSGAIERVLDDLLRWSGPEVGLDEPEGYVREWDQAGRPPAIADASYPRCAARLCLMRERLREGYTSFWL